MISSFIWFLAKNLCWEKKWCRNATKYKCICTFDVKCETMLHNENAKIFTHTLSTVEINVLLHRMDSNRKSTEATSISLLFWFIGIANNNGFLFHENRIEKCGNQIKHNWTMNIKLSGSAAKFKSALCHCQSFSISSFNCSTSFFFPCKENLSTLVCRSFHVVYSSQWMFSCGKSSCAYPQNKSTFIK